MYYNAAQGNAQGKNQENHRQCAKFEMRDVGNTRQNHEEPDSAITSGLCLKCIMRFHVRYLRNVSITMLEVFYFYMGFGDILE